MKSRHGSRAETPKLPPGRKVLPRSRVTELQRQRILSAVAEVVDEVGYLRMTVAQVIARARVSRKTFYDVFDDREDCFLAAFEQAAGQARLVAVEAFEHGVGWREGLRGALARLLTFVDEEPELARLCVVEALAAGPRAAVRRGELLGEIAHFIDRGRLLTSREPPEVTAEGVVGGILAVLHGRLLDESRGPTSELLGPMMGMIVLPYLGARAAKRELARPAAEPGRRQREASPRRGGDPLAGLKIRLTYRTVRVLMVVAEQPGASNREVADSSGIVDQGQISKLLGRLEGLGLLENRGLGQAKGAANAWHLSERGAQIERATRPR
jgi:AcrR family transcriptional regulator